MPRTQPQSALEPQLEYELDAYLLEGDPDAEQTPQSRFMNVDEREARLWRWLDTEEFFILMRSITFMLCIALVAAFNPFVSNRIPWGSPLEHFLTHSFALLFLILGLLDLRQFRSHEKMRRHVLRLANTNRHFALGLTMCAVAVVAFVAYRPHYIFNRRFDYYYWVFNDWWGLGVGVIAACYGTMSLYRAYQVKKLRELDT